MHFDSFSLGARHLFQKLLVSVIFFVGGRKGCFFKFGVEVGVGESIESTPLV
jgi:hypothetical protein